MGQSICLPFSKAANKPPSKVQPIKRRWLLKELDTCSTPILLLLCHLWPNSSCWFLLKKQTQNQPDEFARRKCGTRAPTINSDASSCLQLGGEGGCLLLYTKILALFRIDGQKEEGICSKNITCHVRNGFKVLPADMVQGRTADLRFSLGYEL